jgi:DNA replication protein DnaC
MLSHPTLDILHELGLYGCAKGFKELEANPAAASLSHAEWLAILLEHEVTLRRQKRFEARASRAKLRQAATVEDVDYRADRQLDRTLFLKLTSCQWIRDHRHVIFTGKTGLGKSWLACALGHKACRENLSVLYYRAHRLFAALDLARGDGRYAKLLASLGRPDLLIIDDFGPEPLAAEHRRDLLEIVEDRYGRGSLLITSQVPVNLWHKIIGDPTLGDAILDRITHAAYRFELDGETMRPPLDDPQGSARKIEAA